MSTKRLLSDISTETKDDVNVKRLKVNDPSDLYLYSLLADGLPSLPAPIVRMVLSMCDAFLLSCETRVQRPNFLPALSGRYKTLALSKYAGPDFMARICVGMRLDVLNSDNDMWNIGTVLQVDRRRDDSDDDKDNRYNRCCVLCEECASEHNNGDFDQSHYDRVLITYNNALDNKDEEWISLDRTCDNCNGTMNTRLKPFLSAWDNSYDHAELDVCTYLRLGTYYPRPYLDNYTAWIVQKESEFLHDPICLRITDNDDGEDIVYQEIDLQLLTRNCNNLGCIDVNSFAAMTCDDNGRIYALTRPCHRLVVFTNGKGSDDYEMVMYSLGDEIACETTGIQSFIMSIADASMVLSIQQLQQTDDGPRPVCTYAFALPLVQTITPALTIG